jgi:hypothetical protein
MIAMTDTISLFFNTKSRLKSLQNILHLCSWITVSNFENTTVLHYVNSPALIWQPYVNQILLMCEIPRPQFPHFHPKIALKISKGVYYAGVHCYLLYVLIFVGNLCFFFCFAKVFTSVKYSYLYDSLIFSLFQTCKPHGPYMSPIFVSCLSP